MRVLLDSNVWLAILTTDGFCRRLWKKIRRHHPIFTSQELLEEIESKLQLKFGFSIRHSRLLMLFVEHHTVQIEVVSKITACRDAADNKILAAAIDGKCSCLVTGDKDLLVLKNFRGIAIVTPREHFELLEKS